MLPKSIGKLVQLETLDFKYSRIRELPVEIKRLLKLRHLLGYSYFEASMIYNTCSRQGFKVQGGLGCWKTLKKLYYVDANSGETIKELVKFTKLRKLGITNVRSKDEIQLCRAIEKMKEIRSLEMISVIDEEQVLDLESIHSPPPLLRALSVIGRLKSLPSWINKLQNLVRLNLYRSGLTNDPLGSIQNFPNLLDLGIGHEACEAGQLHFKRGWFQKLKVLTLICSNELEELIIEEGALPRLEKMTMRQVGPQMMEVPSGIQHLTNLNHMGFIDFAEEMCEKMVPDGPSWSIIQHIPNVRFYFTDGPDECIHFTPADYHQYRKAKQTDDDLENRIITLLSGNLNMVRAGRNIW